MSFHMEAIAAAKAARAEADAAEKRAKAARILAQVACPHDDAATVHYGDSAYYRICKCCGLQVHDWHGAWDVIGKGQGALPWISADTGKSLRFGPSYHSADAWRKASET